jgi:hypothetical protein
MIVIAGLINITMTLFWIVAALSMFVICVSTVAIFVTIISEVVVNLAIRSLIFLGIIEDD